MARLSREYDERKALAQENAYNEATIVWLRIIAISEAQAWMSGSSLRMAGSSERRAKHRTREITGTGPIVRRRACGPVVEVLSLKAKRIGVRPRALDDGSNRIDDQDGVRERIDLAHNGRGVIGARDGNRHGLVHDRAMRRFYLERFRWME